MSSCKFSSTRYTLPDSRTLRTYPRCVTSHSAPPLDALALCSSLPTQDDPQDPHPLPPRASDDALLQAAKTQVQWLLASPAFTDKTCPLCIATLQVAKFLSLAAPEQGPPFFVFLCQQFKLTGACNTTFSRTTLGPVLTQVLANADVVGYDGQVRTGSRNLVVPRRCFDRGPGPLYSLGYS
jgi:hypothetical protein